MDNSTINTALNFSGKTALITGVLNQQSIAWPIAKYLSDGGAKVILTLQRKAMRRMLAGAEKELGDCHVFECDVLHDDQIDSLYEQVSGVTDRLDILVHSVAFAPLASFENPFYEIAREDYRAALDVSAYSLIALTRGALPLMKGHGGSILGLTYMASEKVIPGYKLMSVAKSALECIIRNLAYELGEHKIRVNGISPGPISTKAATSIPGFELMQEHVGKYAPLRSTINPEDVGKTALYLCGSLAEKITGEIVHVDGGYNVMGMSLER